jgi:phosphoribosylglycinamide formyltransferase-1
MRNIVILISGGGSNMAAIVRAAQREDWPAHYGARVAAVISNRAEAGGLTFARERGIATDVVAHGRTARCNDIIFSLMQKQHLKSVKKHFSKTLP